jgi:RNA polymerase sigma-70 factor (ECF subfamily)
LRWARSHGHEVARFGQLDDGDTLIADQFDIEVELERDELASLLDRALALLPPDTRDVLVQKYVRQSPHAEIAARLGLSENAVAVRVHRGKLALRQVLMTRFQDAAVAYGLVEPEMEQWQKTRIWCPRCGQHHLLGRFDHTNGALALRCPTCFPQPDMVVCDIRAPQLLHGVQGYRAAFSRAIGWAGPYFRQALVEPPICSICGTRTVVQKLSPSEVPPSLGHTYGVRVQCATCDPPSFASLHGLTLDLPKVRRFWRIYPRIRSVPERAIEVGGRDALLLRIEDVTGAAGVDVIFARDTFEMLDVHGANDA